jgi:hypothetical protein
MKSYSILMHTTFELLLKERTHKGGVQAGINW